MDYLVEIIVIIISAVVWYSWYEYYRIRTVLNWLPYAPSVPILGNALDFKDSTTTLPLFDDYCRKNGDTLVITVLNRQVILSQDYKFLEAVLSSGKILDKSDDYLFLRRWLKTGLLTAGGQKWKPRRKMITPSFHFSILEQFVDVFEAQGNILMKKLEKEVDKDTVNIYPYITLCALDVICETAMGVTVNAQDNHDSEYVSSVKEMCRIIVTRSFSAIKMFEPLYKLTQDYQIEKKALNTLHGYTSSVILQRIEELKKSKETEQQDNHTNFEDDVGVKKKKAFLDLLLMSTIDGEPLSKEDVMEEVDTFMFEGHDTTASAMSFIIYCLSTNLEEQQKAFEEQKEIFAGDMNRPNTYRDLQSMKYLENVIKEALRLYPSVPFYARQVSEDFEYNKNIIPKGLTVTIYAFGMNRHPDYYENPDKFIPSRFDENVGKHPFAYLPFSAGPRNCIGQKFAMLEMKSLISKFIRTYELLPSIPEHINILAAETVLKSSNGIHVRFKKRVW